MPRGYLGEVEMRDFSGDRKWFHEHRAEYQGKYVATFGNKLIATGTGLGEVIDKARAAGFPEALCRYIDFLDALPFVRI